MYYSSLHIQQPRQDLTSLALHIAANATIIGILQNRLVSHCHSMMLPRFAMMTYCTWCKEMILGSVCMLCSVPVHMYNITNDSMSLWMQTARNAYHIWWCHAALQLTLTKGSPERHTGRCQLLRWYPGWLLPKALLLQQPAHLMQASWGQQPYQSPSQVNSALCNVSTNVFDCVPDTPHSVH